MAPLPCVAYKRAAPRRSAASTPVSASMASGEFSGSETKSRHCRSEEHTSELQSLMRISYAVFCLKKKKQTHHHTHQKTRRTPTCNTPNRIQHAQNPTH